jgi:hypothetical protein
MYSDKIHIELFDEFINQPDWRSIIDWIENHGYWFLVKQKRKYSTKKFNWQELADFKIHVTSLKVSYEDEISNSHSCPRNGLTNWHSKPNLPRGYPGWRGDIEFEILPQSSSEDIDAYHILNDAGIYLGTGGSTNGLYHRYDVKFFEDDWPGLMNYRVFNSLSDEGITWKRYMHESLTMIVANHYKKQYNKRN